MVKFEERVVINRPAEEVFAFISDLENDPPWTSAAEARRTSEGPIGVGTTFQQRSRSLGRRLEISFEVVGYEPDHIITLNVTTGAPSLGGTRTVDPVGENASQVTASGGGQGRGVEVGRAAARGDRRAPLAEPARPAQAAAGGSDHLATQPYRG